jgi:hypothetical protein
VDLLAYGSALFFIESAQRLLHGSDSSSDIQRVLGDLPRYARHVRGTPCKDFGVCTEKVDEHYFLFGVELGADPDLLGGIVAGVERDEFVSGTRVMPSKSFASVLASSVRLELACCGETALVFVSDARSTPNVSPVGAPAPSTRSTADEVPPPAWPWLPRLLLRRRGRRQDKPGCCSSATWGRRR